MFNVQLIGKEELVIRLDAMPGEVLAALITKANELAILLQAHIVRDKLSGQVLNVVAGALRRSIQEEVTHTTTAVEARVFSSGDVKYAAIHEFGGTIPEHDVYPTKGQALHFFAGGDEVFARHVHIPTITMPERSFMRSSLADLAAEITGGLKQAVIMGLQQGLRA